MELTDLKYFDYDELEKISPKYEIRGRKGDPDYCLDKKSFSVPSDYDLYPDKEWIDKETWEEFLSKASYIYWLSFEEILWEYRGEPTEYRLKEENK